MTTLRLLAAALLAVLLGACNEAGTVKRPVNITLFKATPATIGPGGTTTLEWGAAQAKSCQAQGTLPGWSGAKEASGTQILTVADAGTYEAKLVCDGAGASTDTESVSVTVSSTLVDILSFTATPGTVVQGGTTTFNWTTANATNCFAEGLPEWTGIKPAAGPQTLTLSTLGSFQARLVCTGSDNQTASSTIAVNVTAAPSEVTIDSFSADPSTLVTGASTHLSWTSTGATACTAGGDLPGWTGALAVAGEQNVTVPNVDGDYTAQLTCSNAVANAQAQITVTVTLPTRHRYSMANRCFALKAASNRKYVVAAGMGYAATADAAADAEPFFLKPSALGEYLLYNKSKRLVTAAVAPSNPDGATCTPPGQAFCPLASAAATDSSVFVVKGAGDVTAYPVPPQYDTETTAEVVATYRNFVDPYTEYSYFTLASKPDGRQLTANATSGAISLVAPVADSNTQQFFLESGLANCAPFPEAQSNAVGNTYKGTTADGRVVGFADTHVHVTATTFLGGAHAGAPFHKFGVEHAVGDCEKTHGEGGKSDTVGNVFDQDFDGHATDGYPTFTEWPSRRLKLDEAMYWKWIERAWLGGLRILVNDLVDNGTLCELQRNALDPNDPRSTSENCNEMQTAREQASSTYAMQDYIDAQYGGRGKGFWQVVWTPAEARQVIADGKMAVVMGVEITNLFDCQLTYNPARTKEPFEEPTNATQPTPHNTYKCSMAETGAPNEIKTQMDVMYALGMRQLISIHEFDTAFGGNGIFDSLVLNLGNRENSGGNPTPGVPPGNPFDPPEPPSGETPTGEFWTTYSCATEAELAELTPGDGYLWEESGGKTLQNVGPPPPLCQPAGQGGRSGGSTACYPAENQCNARWMTPIGLYLYKMMMEYGLLFDFDHMTIDMKTQALELAEAQDPPYPFISTHGTFGGTTLEQARRVFANGGHLFPSVGSSTGLIDDMIETRPLWEAAAGSPNRTTVFGFGFGTDTNGLSAQAAPRSSENRSADGAVVYPFKLFDGELFDAIPEFATLDDDGNPDTPYTGVVFNQPEEDDEATSAAPKKWHADVDGTAHAGMVTDMVNELRLNAIAAAQRDSVPLAQRVQHVRDLYNSAEMYLQTWEKTIAARDAILANGNGGKTREPTATPVLREAWGPNNPAPWEVAVPLAPPR